MNGAHLAARPLPCARLALRLLATAFLLDALAWLPAVAVINRQVAVPASFAVMLFGLSLLTRGRMPGFGWGIGTVLAMLGVVGGTGELLAVPAVLDRGVADLPVLARGLLVLVAAGFLLVGGVRWWRWLAARPPKPTPLAPIAWR